MSEDRAALTADEKVKLRIAAFGICESQPHDEHLLEAVEAILNRLREERDEARSLAEAAEENRVSLANQLIRTEAEARRIAAQRDEFEAEKDGAWAEVERLTALVVDHSRHIQQLTAERDEYERRWEEDARPAFAIVKAVERLADKIGATPDWSMSHRNVATSIRTALAGDAR